MNNQNLKNAFYKSRTLVGRLSTSFSFLHDHLLLFIKLSLYILAPLAVIQGIASVYYGFISPDSVFSVSHYAIMAFMFVLIIITTCVYNSLLYTLLQKYSSGNFLPVYKSLKEIKEPLIKNAKKLLVVGVVIGVVVVLLGLLSVFLLSLSPYTLIITLPLLFFIFLPFSYTGYIYVFEEIALLAALKKSFKVGIKYWGGTFVILFFISIPAGIIQLICSLPYILGVTVVSLVASSVTVGDVVNLPWYYSFLIFLLTIISFLGSYLAQIFIVVPMGFQYGNVEAVRKEQLLIQQELN